MKEKHGVIRDNTLGTLSSFRAVIMMKVSGKEGDLGKLSPGRDM